MFFTFKKPNFQALWGPVLPLGTKYPNFPYVSLAPLWPSLPPLWKFFWGVPPPSETKKRAGGLADRPALPSPLKEVQTSFLNFLWNFTPPLEEQKEGWEGWGRAGRKASCPQPDFRFLGPLGVIFFTLYSEINPKISDFWGEGIKYRLQKIVKMCHK